MPPCKHHEICGRDALQGECLCILHSQNPDKDKNAFDEALVDHREKKGDDFRKFVFQGNAHFSGVKFNGDVSFEEAKFRGGADFGGAKFGGSVDFRAAQFSSRTLFDYAFWDDDIKVIFTDVIVEPLDVITFRNTDLRTCRFLGTDLRKIEFTKVMWPRKGGRFRVYDEDVELKEGESREWTHIEKLYRDLKQNYEDRRDYERASDFHYSEKEMRRKNKKGAHLGLRFLLTLYWLVSGYGERWIRPLIWAAGLLVVCAVLYLFLPAGLHPKNGGAALVWTSLWDWLRSAFYSFRVMTLLRPDDFAPIGYAKLVHAFESLAGPLIIGLFGLAVRQRLRR